MKLLVGSLHLKKINLMQTNGYKFKLIYECQTHNENLFRDNIQKLKENACLSTGLLDA